MQLKQRLSAVEREKLAELMGRNNPTGPLGGSVTRLHGFFTSVVSGPMVGPSEWLPVVFGGDAGAGWPSAADARDGMSLAMRFYNEVASDLGPDGRYSIMVDRVGQEDGGDQPLPLAIEWARGYVIGVNVRPDAWNAAIEDTHLGRSFETIYRVAQPSAAEANDPIEKPKAYAELLDALPGCVARIAGWWRAQLASSGQSGLMTRPGSTTVHRAQPKVSPNAPCTCGSGKKYKRCCSPFARS